MKPATGPLVKLVAQFRPNELHSVAAAMIPPGEHGAQGLIRRIKKNAIVHEGIDAYRVDSLTGRECQLFYCGFEVVEDGCGRERRRTVGIRFEAPPGLDETS